ncbi:hypothetical protein AZE42_10160 [Rhizopogon vesiculosus]|uniref:Uncharacterized protein n=1 Tax=Rhizopogon vesiculosus TaxID=180088 RepID=A0A1J8PR47_9AGAM|nr:hypothetical protein AZE42_10160 [Rhizopogon vesiculosus]
MSELSFAEFSQAFSPPTLVPTLNALLIALSLPFEIASPTDMTPSLLLAVLESSRLPIPAAQTDLSMHDAPPVESDTSIAYSELSDGTETNP